MVVLIDIGNTRVKGALLADGALTLWPTLATQAVPVFAAWPAELVAAARPRRVLVSNVAGPGLAGELAQFAFEHWQVEAEFVLPERTRCGMTTRYRDPRSLGVDRWLAALAAWRACRQACCVVDMGTALTVDVVTAAGAHLGGLIAPGLELMRTSLTAGTAALRSERIEAVAGFADNTRDAISLGCRAALAGLLAQVRTQLTATPGCTDAAWYVTGGGGPVIASLLEHPCRADPELVLRGLAVLAEEAS